MSTVLESYRNLARHNEVMNRRLYAVVAAMDPSAVHEDRGGFFDSIFGGLTHIVFGDHFILTRVRSAYGAPSRLDAVPPQWQFEPTKRYGDDLAEVADVRARIDEALTAFADALTDADLAKSVRGPNGDVPLWVLLDHLFQHQTHHRGQVTTLLTQLGTSYGSIENPIEVYLQTEAAE